MDLRLRQGRRGSSVGCRSLGSKLCVNLQVSSSTTSSSVIELLLFYTEWRDALRCVYFEILFTATTERSPPENI